MEGLTNAVRVNLNAGVCERLQLVKCRLGREGFETLSNALVSTSTLRVLQLNNFDMSETALRVLSDGVKRSESLRVLDLAYCAIGDKLGYWLAKLLKDLAAERDQRLWIDSLRPRSQTVGTKSSVTNV